MHTHPDRLLHSLARQPDGSFTRIPVAQAMDEIAEQLGRIVEEHGPLAVALYSGTFGLANALTAPLTNAFREALGNPRGWVATSIDQPGKTIAQGLMGVWMALHQGPATADVCMIIGSNPLISIAAGLPQADPRKWLHDAKKRGFKLIVIDPRRHETASQADIYLQPKPAEDIAIVGGMIRLIVDEGLLDQEFVAAETTGIEELRRAVDPFDPETVARRADIPVDDFVAAARMFATAGRGVAVAGTGPGMSSARGTLLEYLILALNALCGRYLREGELVWNPGTLVEPVPRFAQASGPFPSYGFEPKLRVRGLGDTLVGPSTAAIADEILEPGAGQIRALISCGGNPLAAWPDQLKVREALESVELLVQFDPWMSATAKLAHYVIAPTLSLEVPGMTNYVDMLPAYAPGYGLPKPWAQYTPAIVDPPEGSDVIPEWEFFYGLAQRMGLALEVRPVDFNGPTGATLPIPMDVKPTADELLTLLTSKARIPLAEVAAVPERRGVRGAVVGGAAQDGRLGGAPRPGQRAHDARPARAERAPERRPRVVGRRPVPVPARRPAHEHALQLRGHDRTAPAGAGAHEPGLHASGRPGAARVARAARSPRSARPAPRSSGSSRPTTRSGADWSR